MFKATKRVTSHPGQILAMILEENKITQTELAAHLGLPQTKISEICRGKRGISAEMARKLEKAIGMSADLWMNLQTKWELSQVDESKLTKVRKMRFPKSGQIRLAA